MALMSDHLLLRLFPRTAMASRCASSPSRAASRSTTGAMAAAPARVETQDAGRLLEHLDTDPP